MQTDKLDNYLRTYRKKLGLTQREVAFLLRCHGGAKVSRYERSGRIPDLKTIFAYEVIFQKPARELFAGIYDRAERETLRKVRQLVSRLRKRQESPSWLGRLLTSGPWSKAERMNCATRRSRTDDGNTLPGFARPRD